MDIIKLNAIDSTNSYLRQLCTTQELQDLTVVMTKLQLNGRGQMGTTWYSEAGKNLTCSVFKAIDGLPLDQSFAVSMVTSLAMIRTLKRFNIPRLRIKWPNDILSENLKICGILIENVTKNYRIEASILGIGLNVNQTFFSDLPQATSLKNITGNIFDLEELLMSIQEDLKFYFNRFKGSSFEAIKLEYEDILFRRGKPSTFRDGSGEQFPGFIKGVDGSGNLIVRLEDDLIQTFGLKEIQLLY
ncbi:MAG: biotin--[acetyl-CoA-carboxylase] ligase [Bacteroidia bacterium]|nr:biotin--[acetyl-CoA-carboxylase] ligase [Bacteroidia bacterium]NNK73056.1 biotin--[acetyl-CoA-carboxylase] ligase [Flavobacteriaceae bacterium]